MGFKSEKITGDGTVQVAFSNSSILESVINSLVAYNFNGTEEQFIVLFDGVAAITENVPANGSFRIPDKVNVPLDTDVTVSAVAGVDVTISYFQQAVDVASANTATQQAVIDSGTSATEASSSAQNASDSEIAAKASEDLAAAYAAGVNVPAVLPEDKNKVLTVKSDGSGYELKASAGGGIATQMKYGAL